MSEATPLKFGSFKCSLCGEESHGYGHNPEPLKEYGQRCCDQCNREHVIPARIMAIVNLSNKKKNRA